MLPRLRRNGSEGAVTASGATGTGRPGAIAGGETPARIRAPIPVGIITRIRGRILVGIIVRIRHPIPGPTIAIIPAALASGRKSLVRVYVFSPLKPLAQVFDTNIGGIDVSFENSLSRRERARVRGSNEVHSLFLPLILTFSRREKEPCIVPA